VKQHRELQDYYFRIKDQNDSSFQNLESYLNNEKEIEEVITPKLFERDSLLAIYNFVVFYGLTRAASEIVEHFS